MLIIIQKEKIMWHLNCTKIIVVIIMKIASNNLLTISLIFVQNRVLF